jgi:hypothetical protein
MSHPDARVRRGAVTGAGPASTGPSVRHPSEPAARTGADLSCAADARQVFHHEDDREPSGAKRVAPDHPTGASIERSRPVLARAHRADLDQWASRWG